MLVEAKKIGSVIKRLFTGSIREIFDEVFQNSQRSGAKNVAMVTDQETGTVTITDDGTGLSENAGTGDQFLPVITVARSAYADEKVLDQQIMGIGLFSLLSKDGVEKVEIASNNLELSIDTAAIWTGEDFWENWRECIKATDFGAGFRLTIKATAQIVKEIESVVNTGRTSTVYEIEPRSPARGYFDILRITLNGDAVDTSNPHNIDNFNLLIGECDFKGSRLLVGYNYNVYHSSVNWFGQIIKAARQGRFQYYLHVRQGTPLTPMSPTRRGIVDNELLADLHARVRELITDYVSNPENRKNISTGMLGEVAQLDSRYFQNDCPYFIGGKLAYNDNPESAEDFDGDASEVLAYAEHETVIDSRIMVANPHSEPEDTEYLDKIEGENGEIFYSYGYGISSFVPQIGQLVTMHNGNGSRLAKKYLFWRVGAPMGDDIFFGKGEYALADKKDAIPEAFAPVTCRENVIAFENPHNFDLDSCDELSVGIDGSLSSKIRFYEKEGFAVWDKHHDDYSYDEMHADFSQNLKASLNALFTDTVEESVINLYQIKHQFDIKQEDKVSAIFFTSNDDGTPRGIRVETESGIKTEKEWLGRRLATYEEQEKLAA